jgi:uncharacterized short protein YbdD (DUF466 family)
MSKGQYLNLVDSGRIPSGALVFQTRHSNWNSTNFGSRGFDSAIARNGGRNLWNGAMNGSLIYGQGTQKVIVLVPGGSMAPSQERSTRVLAKKDGKEGFIIEENGQKIWREGRWTSEDKRRLEETKKTQQTASTSQPPQSSSQAPRTPSSGPLLRGTLSRKEIEDYVEKMRKMKPGSGESLRIPGVGTFVKGKDWLGRPEEKYFHPDGKPMGQEEFADKIRKLYERSSPLSGDLSFNIPNSLADQAIRRKYGGLVYKNGNSPTLPSQKYSSYGGDQSPQIAIQPVIISNQVPVPVSSGAVPFAVPVISSSDTRLT